MRGMVPKTEANLLMHSDLWVDERAGQAEWKRLAAERQQSPTQPPSTREPKGAERVPSLCWALQRAVMESKVTEQRSLAPCRGRK